MGKDCFGHVNLVSRVCKAREVQALKSCGSQMHLCACAHFSRLWCSGHSRMVFVLLGFFFLRSGFPQELYPCKGSQEKTSLLLFP